MHNSQQKPKLSTNYNTSKVLRSSANQSLYGSELHAGAQSTNLSYVHSNVNKAISYEAKTKNEM